MSITCALMSTRPSSNTANRPTGPAPTITASVLIISSGIAGSELLVGDADHEAVERIGDLDLTGEPALRPDIEGEIEHVLLHLLRLPRGLAPRLLDINVTSRAGARSPALCGDAGDRILHRGLHHSHAGLRLDDAFRPVALNKGDRGHDIGALRLEFNLGGSGQRLTLAPEDEGARRHARSRPVLYRAIERETPAPCGGLPQACRVSGR